MIEEGCSIGVPKPWNISKSSGEEDTLLFTFVTKINSNGVEKYVLEKCLVINSNREIVRYKCNYLYLTYF